MIERWKRQHGSNSQYEFLLIRRLGRLEGEIGENCTGQIKVEQKTFTTEPPGHGVLPLFFSVTPCLSGSKNVQPIPDEYKSVDKGFHNENY